MNRSAPRRSPRALLAALLASTALAACASVPDLGERPTPKAATALAAAQSLAAPAAEWPADAWWTAYGDPQLTGLIEEALRDSPTLAVAGARVRRAEALAQQAGSALRPSLGATLAANAAKAELPSSFPIDAGGVNTIGYGILNASYGFDFFGRNRAALAAATSDVEAARAEQAQARLTLSTAIAAAYADLAQLHDEIDAAEEAVQVRTRTRELMSQRAANGLENSGPAAQAESTEADALGLATALRESAALTRNRIAALVGAGPDRGLSIQRPSTASVKAFGLPSALQAELIGRRPDIVSARLRAEAAASRIKQARADYYPNVNLSAMLGVASLDLASLANRVAFASAGPAISLPIFDNGRLEGRYRAADAEYREAVGEYDRTLTQALQDVADVATSERALAHRLTIARTGLAAADRAYRIAQARYEGGLSTFLDVLRAEDQLVTARRSVAGLQTRAFALDIALVRALGGGFAERPR